MANFYRWKSFMASVLLVLLFGIGFVGCAGSATSSKAFCTSSTHVLQNVSVKVCRDELQVSLSVIAGSDKRGYVSITGITSGASYKLTFTENDEQGKIYRWNIIYKGKTYTLEARWDLGFQDWSIQFL